MPAAAGTLGSGPLLLTSHLRCGALRRSRYAEALATGSSFANARTLSDMSLRHGRTAEESIRIFSLWPSTPGPR